MLQNERVIKREKFKTYPNRIKLAADEAKFGEFGSCC
jgi:hypothetical protein